MTNETGLGSSDNTTMLPLDVRVRGAFRDYDAYFKMQESKLKNGDTTLYEVAEGIIQIYDRWGIDQEGRARIGEIHSRQRVIAERNIDQEMKDLLTNPINFVIQPRVTTGLTINYVKLRLTGLYDRARGKY